MLAFMDNIKLSESISKMLEKASDYCVSKGLSKSTLGRFIVNDGKFFDRIEQGGGCTMETYEKVMSWLSTNKPKKSKSKKPN